MKLFLQRGYMALVLAFVILCYTFWYISKNTDTETNLRPIKPQVKQQQWPPKPNHVILDGRCDKCYTWKSNKTFLLPSKSFCSQDSKKSIDLLIIVISRVKNIQHRDILRGIYTEDLSPQMLKQIRLLFAFGKGNINTYDQLLQSESDKYGDIITFNVRDDYFNLHQIFLNTLLWVHENCSNVLYTVKMTDDAFINIPGVLTVLNMYGKDQLRDVVFGHCTKNQPTVRKHKVFALTVEQYPFPWYPRFCGGSGIFMSLETGKAIINEVSNVRYAVPFDDLIIGITARLAKRCVCHIDGFNFGYRQVSKTLVRILPPNLPVNCTRFTENPFLSIHLYNSPDPMWMRHIWRYRKCYENFVPKDVKCYRWGECPDDAYPLPRG